MNWIRMWGMRCAILLLILSVLSPGLAVIYGQTNVQVTVLPYQLNVRELPGFDTAIIGYYDQGTVLNISGWDGTVWVFATPLSGDLTGWVNWEYVDFPAGFDVGTLPVITTTGTAGIENAPPPSENEAPAPALAPGQLSGSTVDTVNLRAGPGTTYSILQTLPAETPLILTERSADAAWLKVQVGDQSGWLFAQFVSTSNDIWSLPDTTADPAASSNVPNAAAPSSASPFGIVHESAIPVISAHAHEIFLRGQEMGNRPDVFVTVGDSITTATMFLDPIGLGFYNLGDYASLQATIDYFSPTPARTGNSFANENIAAHGAWTTHNLVTPGLHFRNDICNPDETALVCEYRLTRPAVALIMIGTNDVSAGMETIHFRHSMEIIVQVSLHFGVIPILSTVPDNLSGDVDNVKVYEFNNVIRDVAAAYDVPLLDYWRAMQAIPNKGLSNDGIHPSYDETDPYSTANFTGEYLYYGYNMRNLTALLALEAMWRGAIY